MGRESGLETSICSSGKINKRNVNVILSCCEGLSYSSIDKINLILYRAVDSEGNTIDFYLSKSRNHKTAKHFFKKASQSFHVSKPRVITVDKNPAYPIAIEWLKEGKGYQ